jgi:hypothetical protein
MSRFIFVSLLLLPLSGCFNGDDSKPEVPEVNTPPVAMDAQLITQTEVAINDSLEASDKESDMLSFALEQEAGNGTVTVMQNGEFSYTPDIEYTGTDSFRFSVTDNQNPPVFGQVSITIEALPVLFSNLSRNAFEQSFDAMPLRLNGRDISNDVMEPTAYDDLLVDE